MLMFSMYGNCNYEEIKWNPERVSNAKLFINKYKWKGINCPSKIDDWKTSETNNPTIPISQILIGIVKNNNLINDSK